MICSMQSSTSHSNYGKCPASDFQYRPASRSIYETEHRLFATLSSTHYFFGPESPTTFNLFFERKSGLPGTVTLILIQVLVDIKLKPLATKEEQ